MKSYVGIARFRLDMVSCSSLKDKRHFMRSIIDRLGNSKITGAAEIGERDAWKSGGIAVACVSSSRSKVEEALESARRTIEGGGVEVLAMDKWVLDPEDL